jgi:hypothetical protein
MSLKFVINYTIMVRYAAIILNLIFSPTLCEVTNYFMQIYKSVLYFLNSFYIVVLFVLVYCQLKPRALIIIFL